MIFALLCGKNPAKTFRDTPLYQGLTPLAIHIKPRSGFLFHPRKTTSPKFITDEAMNYPWVCHPRKSSNDA